MPILITALAEASIRAAGRRGVSQEQINWMIRIHSGNVLVRDPKLIDPFRGASAPWSGRSPD